jgi:curved DNA-binding protein CbpA
MKNHYDILGLDSNASFEDIKKAYRKLSVKFHPDKNNGEDYFAAMFRQINEAYSVLSDVDKRRSYDNVLKEQADVASRAQAVRNKERDLAYREQQLRQSEIDASVRSNRKPTSSEKISENSPDSPSIAFTFTIKHVKYLFWVIILGLILRIGSEPKSQVKHQYKPKQYTKSKTKHKKKKAKRKHNVKEIKADPDTVVLEELATNSDSSEVVTPVNLDTLNQ